MSDELPMAPDVQRLSDITRSGAPLVESGLLKNLLTSLVITMHNADWRRHTQTDGSDADTPQEVKRNNRMHVLDLGRNTGMSVLAQLLAHGETSVFNGDLYGDNGFNVLNLNPHTLHDPRNEKLFADYAHAPVSSDWHKFIKRIQSKQCHSAIIFGTASGRDFIDMDHRLDDLLNIIPLHGRIFVIR